MFDFSFSLPRELFREFCLSSSFSGSPDRLWLLLLLTGDMDGRTLSAAPKDFDIWREGFGVLSCPEVVSFSLLGWELLLSTLLFSWSTIDVADSEDFPPPNHDFMESSVFPKNDCSSASVLVALGVDLDLWFPSSDLAVFVGVILSGRFDGWLSRFISLESRLSVTCSVLLWGIARANLISLSPIGVSITMLLLIWVWPLDGILSDALWSWFKESLLVGIFLLLVSFGSLRLSFTFWGALSNSDLLESIFLGPFMTFLEDICSWDCFLGESVIQSFSSSRSNFLSSLLIPLCEPPKYWSGCCILLLGKDSCDLLRGPVFLLLLIGNVDNGETDFLCTLSNTIGSVDLDCLFFSTYLFAILLLVLANFSPKLDDLLLCKLVNSSDDHPLGTLFCSDDLSLWNCGKSFCSNDLFPGKS